MIQSLFHINLSDRDSRNTFYLVAEIFWASILAAAASFNAAFAIRLGAENVQVGLLTSLPALFALLVSIPAGQFLQSRIRRKPWIVGALAISRFGYVFVALVPLLHLAGVPHGTLVVWILVLASIPSHFFNVGFIPMQAEVIPEDRRAAVISARNIIYNASYSICTLLLGLWLNQIEFPVNYQAMYVLGFLTSCLSTWFLIKIEAPDAKTTTRNSGLIDAFQKQARILREAVRDHPGFVRITRNTVCHGMGLWIASPLYTLYFVKSLHATDAWIGIQGTVLSAATIAGYLFWRRLMSRWGEPRTLKRTIVCAGIYPLLVGILPSLDFILLAVALNGIVAAGINLSHFSTLLKLTPEDNRPGYTALYITITNCGAFIGPLIGVAVAGIVGTGPTLIACGLLSIIGSTSFWIWPVRQSHDNHE